MILSTGMSSWAEIEDAVTLLKEEMAAFALLHCRSAYPVWPREANLKMITKLKQFNVPVGYSSHDEGSILSIIAASMGCCIIEKHISLDKSLPGPDHKVSLLPYELKTLVRDIRVVDQAMQDNERFLLRDEIMNREIFRYKGRDYTPKTPQTLEKPYGNWGLIARMPDLQKVMDMNPKIVEIRFTENDFKHEFVPYKYNSELVLHSPEYLEHKLADLCSGNGTIRSQSINILQKTIDKALYLKDYFIGKPKIVTHAGAMSLSTTLKVALLRERFMDSLKQLDTEGVELLLENLPMYAHYFGGTWKTHLFMNADEITEICDESGYNICFDLSHAALYCNAADKDLIEFIHTVKPYTNHIHIGDAFGLSGEGMQLGSGDIDLKAVLPMLDLENTSYVIEVWLAHKNNFEGFVVGLNKIKNMLTKNP